MRAKEEEGREEERGFGWGGGGFKPIGLAETAPLTLAHLLNLHAYTLTHTYEYGRKRLISTSCYEWLFKSTYTYLLST